VSSCHWLQLFAGPLAAALEACLLLAGVPLAVSGCSSPAVLGCPRPAVLCSLPRARLALFACQAGLLAVAGQAGSLGSVWWWLASGRCGGEPCSSILAFSLVSCPVSSVVCGAGAGPFVPGGNVEPSRMSSKLPAVCASSEQHLPKTSCETLRE
jgi:hypothetical protein